MPKPCDETWVKSLDWSWIVKYLKDLFIHFNINKLTTIENFNRSKMCFMFVVCECQKIIYIRLWHFMTLNLWPNNRTFRQFIFVFVQQTIAMENAAHQLPFSFNVYTAILNMLSIYPVEWMARSMANDNHTKNWHSKIILIIHLSIVPVLYFDEHNKH